MDLYFQAWKKYFIFNDRATRSEYWQFVLINIVVGFLLGIISGVLNFEINDGGDSLLTALFALLTIIPHISVSVRRIHDIGLSGWWGWLFIPLALPMLIVAFIGSKK